MTYKIDELLKYIDFYNNLEGKRVIVFGAGELGFKVTSLLNKLSIKVEYYIDNNRAKHGQLYLGRLVYSPEILSNEEKQGIVILTASAYYEEMFEQLSDMGMNYEKEYFNGLDIFIEEKKNASPYYYDNLEARDLLIKSIYSKMSNGMSFDDTLLSRCAIHHGERVVEYPYIANKLKENALGSILDVGCVLNNNVIYEYIPKGARLSFLNPSFEPVIYRNVTYHIMNLEDFREYDKYDLVTCLSTLEHIGFDNTQYGIEELDRGWDWEKCISSFADSVCQLISFAKDGGQVIISCPYGKKEYVLLPPENGVRTSQIICSEHLDYLEDKLRNHKSLSYSYDIFRLEKEGWVRSDKGDSFSSYGSIGPGASGVIMINITKNKFT